MFGGGVARTDQYQDTERERERESMVRVTDNPGLLAVMMCVKTADMVGNWFVQESIICSKRDSILSYPR